MRREYNGLEDLTREELEDYCTTLSDQFMRAWRLVSTWTKEDPEDWKKACEFVFRDTRPHTPHTD